MSTRCQQAVCKMSTQCLHIVSTMSIKNHKNVYSVNKMSTQCVQDVYDMSKTAKRVYKMSTKGLR
jgi:hypothetical protein